MSEHAATGWHFLIDFYDVNPALLCDANRLEHSLNQAAKAASAQVLNSHFHHFGAHQGVTGVLLLAESHMSIHTWPETGFAAIDVFMCGCAEPERALAILRSALRPGREQIARVARGEHMPAQVAA